jgi:hypothetical protein
LTRAAARRSQVQRWLPRARVVKAFNIEGARLPEPMCLLWVGFGYGVRTGTWKHAFKLLRG